MKYLLFLAALALPCLVVGQDQKGSTEPTLKSILLEQLRSTHNQVEWFVPANTAVAGLTAEQASWTDKKGNHSVGQLAAHLVYWRSEERRVGRECRSGWWPNDSNENSVTDE